MEGKHVENDSSLFGPGDDWWHNACLNYSAENSWLYVLGYRQAAETLADHAMETPNNLDSLVFPVLFLYRQYAELILKSIIRDGNRFLNDDPSFPLNHDLNQLWGKARSAILSVCREVAEPGRPEEISPKRLSEVGDTILAYAEKDPGAMAFRYPQDKAGVTHLANIRHINIRMVREAMDRVAASLECAHSVIAHFLEKKQTMETESSREEWS